MRTTSFGLATAFTLSAVGSTTWSSDAAPPPSLRGTEIRSLLSDKELSDDAHYWYRFHANGNVTGGEMGSDVKGRWRTTARQLCLSWSKPRVDEKCYDVRRSRHEVEFVLEGAVDFSGRVMPFGGGAARPTGSAGR